METITAVEFFKEVREMQARTSLALDRLTNDAEQRRQEIDRVLKAMDDRIAKSHEELAKAHAETERAQKNTQEIVGNLGGRFGVLVELLLIPSICPLMNEHGHEFVRVCPNVKSLKGKDKPHTQVDLMLYNTTEVMAVEIKSKLDRSDVTSHIERLKKLRVLEKEFGIKDLTLYGAVAAIVFDDKAREIALDNGLYVIEIREDEDRLTAEPPQEGKIGKW